MFSMHKSLYSCADSQHGMHEKCSEILFKVNNSYEIFFSLILCWNNILRCLSVFFWIEDKANVNHNKSYRRELWFWNRKIYLLSSNLIISFRVKYLFLLDFWLFLRIINLAIGHRIKNKNSDKMFFSLSHPLLIANI